MKYVNIPTAYQKGFVEFYKLKFKVTPDVLIPRPETELLVDEVLKHKDQNPLVLDIGTGAGNIAISISKNSPLSIIATDVSEKALKVARQNAKFHGVENQIRFIQSNLLNKLYPLTPSLESLIIVTNLPYIPSSRIPYLDASVKDWEPKVALDGGEDGFGLYRKLFKQLKQKKINPSILLGEIDYTHGELAPKEVYKLFPKAKVEVKTDLYHRQRILKVTF